MVTKVLLVFWILIFVFYFVTGDVKGRKLKIMLSLTITFAGIVETSCQHLMVHHADRGECNGEYALTNKSVSWAPKKPVYKHVGKNR